MPEDNQQAVVSFGEWDHMLAAAADLMRGESPETIQRLESFFAPEQVDLGEFFAQAGLPGATVELPARGAVDHRLDPDTDVLVVRRAPVTRELLDSLPRLRHIQKLGERTDTVDLAAAAERNITVEFVPRPALEATADHAVLMIMAALRDLPQLDRITRASAVPVDGAPAYGATAYNWPDATFGRTLHGSTVGVIGLGEVGLLVVKRLAAFGVRVLWTDGPDATHRSVEGAEHASLDDLLGQSDAVTLHVPGTDDNRNLVDATFLGKMRRDAVLVNVARGVLVDEAALSEALARGELRGAALDVHAIEPVVESNPLLESDRVILTPHVAGGPRSLMTEELMDLALGVRRALDGRTDGQ